MRTLRFYGRIHEMAQGEILSLIDPVRLQEIRSNDPHPQFRAYSLGHEGSSKGVIVGIGHVVKKWATAMIHELADKLSIGTSAFSGEHRDDNSHEGRTIVAELVGKTKKVIDNVLHAIGVLYIKKEHRDKKLDISSIEANTRFDLIRDDSNNLHANIVEVVDVPGIVLGNSMFQTPGFAGATLQAQIQEFASLEGGDIMTPEEIKRFCRREGIPPSEIFGKKELAADPVVIEIVDVSTEKEKSRLEFSKRKELKEKATAIDGTYNEDMEALKEKLKKSETLLASHDAIDKLKTEMGNGRELNEQQKAFVLLDFNTKFKLQDPKAVDKEIKVYLDSRLDEHKKIVAIFNPGDPGKKDNQQIPTGGVKPNEKKLTVTDENDLTKPENNEFIPVD